MVKYISHSELPQEESEEIIMAAQRFDNEVHTYIPKAARK